MSLSDSILKEKIMAAFPGAESLYPSKKEELDEVWGDLPLYETAGVMRLLPCLMLSAIDAARAAAPMGLASQILIYLDGIESSKPPERRHLRYNEETYNSFSLSQVTVIKEWLSYVRSMSFADAFTEIVDDGLRFWSEREANIRSML